METNAEVFCLACGKGDIETLKKMVKIEPSLVNSFGSILPEHREVMKQNGADTGWTPLHLAAHYGRLEVVKFLIENKADINAKSQNRIANTPLMAAIAGNDIQIVKYLMSKGADPNLTDASGLNALKLAEADRRLQIADVIRKA